MLPVLLLWALLIICASMACVSFQKKDTFVGIVLLIAALIFFVNLARFM